MTPNINLTTNPIDAAELSFEDFKTIVIQDYKIAFESRQASLLGRKEVLSGKAKFGIFGDGKEVPQIAMAKAFKNGDWRSATESQGRYRNGTCSTKRATLRARASLSSANTVARRPKNRKCGGS